MNKQAGRRPGGGTGFRLISLFLALLLIGSALFLGCSASEAPAPKSAHKKAKSAPPGASVSTPGPAAPESTAFEAVDRILAEMEWGNIAFNVPTSLNLQDTATIQLILSLRKPIDELKQIIEAQGEREGAQIRVYNDMEARLSGPDFQITAVTPEKQGISGSEVTKWEWAVKPTKTGRHDLHLTLSAVFTVEGISTSRVIRTFDKTIEVNVTLHQKTTNFLEKNWQWLWTVILIPVAGWLWRRRKTSAG